VVIRKPDHLQASVGRHGCSTVTSVADVAHVVDDQRDDSAASTAVNVSDFILLAFCKLEEELLSLFEALANGFDWVLREVLVFDNELMQVVAEEVCANMSTMTIVYAKERAFWPLHI
jgi:hypothetical protein